MQIRGREVDFKIGRLKDAAAFEKALDKMSKTEKEVNKKGTLSEIIAAEIEMFRAFVKESTGEDVLEDCDDLEEAKGAYIDMLLGIKKQKETLLGFSMGEIK